MDASKLTEIAKFGGKTLYFSNTKIWKALKDIRSYIELVKAIQAIDWLQDLDKDKKEEFYREIKRDIDISPGIDINVEFAGGKVSLYPAGAEELDDKAVNEVLRWLSKYPDVKLLFSNALNELGRGGESRNILDSLRLTLEKFLKEFLNNNKPLEKQKGHLGGFLKEKGVPKSIREIYVRLMVYYTDYQNEYVKHESKTQV